MATLQDIADVVGVSSVTVSKVLRGKIKGSWPRSAAQAERIREVADELGYRVDWRARALKTKRTYMIGLLTTDKPETQMIDVRVLQGLIETFCKADYHLVFVRVSKGSRGKDFADARFDGIVIDYHLEPEELEVIQQAKLPAVIINAPGPEGAFSVMPDHFAAGRVAAEHLLELGHQKIGFVQTSVEEQSRWPHHMIAMWREGIRASMRDAGCLDRYVDIVPKSYSDLDAEDPEVYYRAIREVLASPERPTALIINNPKRAVNKVLVHFKRLGLNIPEDLSFVTMEDLEELDWCSPPVTSVSVPFDRLGQTAATQLLKLIEEDNADIPESALMSSMSSNLVLRRSSAPPSVIIMPAK